MKVKKNVLIVLGMHRSGTSLITQWLHLCGINIGNELVGPSSTNIEGHFEDKEFVTFHEKVLKANYLPDTGLISDFRGLKNSFINELKEIIDKKNDSNSHWAFKDPRTCLFLNDYRSLLPDAKYLIVIRNYSDVVYSLIRREIQYKENHIYATSNLKAILKWKLYHKRKTLKEYSFKYSLHFLLIWITYNEEILKHVNEIERENYILTDYKTLLLKSNSILNIVSKQWLFPINEYNFKKVFNNKLMNDNQFQIDRHIFSKDIIKKADFLQDELRKHHFEFK